MSFFKNILSPIFDPDEPILDDIFINSGTDAEEIIGPAWSQGQSVYEISIGTVAPRWSHGQSVIRHKEGI